MAFVVCTVQPGLRESEVSVVIEDAQGGKTSLRVEEDFLLRQNGHALLPVGIVHIDPQKKVTLIELPHESDSGANRIWVPTASVQQQEQVGV
jgi:hypothetical protein